MRSDSLFHLFNLLFSLWRRNSLKILAKNFTTLNWAYERLGDSSWIPSTCLKMWLNLSSPQFMFNIYNG